MTAIDPLIGQVVADRYQVLELLGAGGMGRVYLAEHVRMGRKSALKVMNPALAVTADAISRFNREAANASRINHPNVAQIYDFGETSTGTLYLAMEYIEGETLTRTIERDGSLSVARAADITKQVADALAAAHHLDIVHRDLKPENIMIARHLDGSDWVKVVDFGIAKTTQQGGGSQTVTTAGVSLGTPEYMSPEQLAGERLDPRSDIYALGLVCFNMLTGDLPYPRLTSRETLVKRLTARPRTLAEVRPGTRWPEELQAALDRALAPEPSDRYGNVAEFGREILRVADGLADADRTVRIRPLAAAAPKSATAPLRGQTRALPRRGRRGMLYATVSVVFVAAAAFAVLRNRGREAHAAPAVTAPANADTSAQPRPVADTSARRDTAAGVTADSAGRPAAPTAAPSATAAERVHVNAPRDSVKLQSRSAEERAVVPEAAAAGTADAPPAPNRTGPHPWLRANGDSGAARTLAADASMQDRLRLFGEEVQGHIQRAGSTLAAGDFRQARQNYFEAAREIGFLHQLLPDSPEVGALQRSLRQSIMQAFQRCKSAVAGGAAAPPGFRCEMLLPGGNRNRPDRRFGEPNQPFGQRQP